MPSPLPAPRASAHDAPLPAPLALYLHIPFCQTKCPYCDFNTYAGALAQRAGYVAALADEIALAGRRVAGPSGQPRACRTINFGGGTPSLLSGEQLARLIGAARAAFAVTEEAEISLEANPGALDLGRLETFRAAGANRLSVGAQSFDAGLLRRLGRLHSPDDVAAAVRAARGAGFASVNLDLMYALPGQDLALWRRSVERALALAPDHLSLYSLIIEDGTPFARWVGQGRLRVPDDDVAAEMYEWAEARLADAGYEHYEISNWALPGHACRHNRVYWRNEPYLGLGAGAHSWYAGHRFAEARPIADYLARVRQALAAEAGGDAPVAPLPAGAVVEDEVISPALERAETAMMGLRLTEGIDLAAFARRFGRSFDDEFGARLAVVRAAGLLETRGGRARLTARGRLLGNEVFERLLPETQSAAG